MSDVSVELQLARAALQSYQNPPRNLFAIARRHVLDCAGVALAGAHEPAVIAVSSQMPVNSTGLTACVLGAQKSLSLRDAATVNGMAAHFHDYDDDDPAVSIGHPTAPVFAALCAASASADASVDRVLAAYVVGVETTMRVGRVVNPEHYNAGWHATATLGVFGATMATALLRGLDDERIAQALGIAASLAAGLKCNFGSDTKPLQVGLAAGNGVLAARLAEAGAGSARGALFGPAGFCTVYGGRGDAAAVIASFGSPFGLAEPGLNIKLYPCCSSAHTAVDGLLEILRDDRVAHSEIASIEAWIGPDVPAMLIYDVPTTPLQAKFSLRYCLAAATHYGELGLEAFTPAALDNAELMRWIERIRVCIDPSLPRIPTGVTHCSRVRVRLKDGTERHRQVADPLGSPVRPIPTAQLREKFVRCAKGALGVTRAIQSFEAWEGAQGSAPFASWLATLCESTAA